LRRCTLRCSPPCGRFSDHRPVVEVEQPRDADSGEVGYLLREVDIRQRAGTTLELNDVGLREAELRGKIALTETDPASRPRQPNASLTGRCGLDGVLSWVRQAVLVGTRSADGCDRDDPNVAV